MVKTKFSLVKKVEPFNLKLKLVKKYFMSLDRPNVMGKVRLIQFSRSQGQSKNLGIGLSDLKRGSK